MRFAGIAMHNWRNFRTVEIPLEGRLFVVGPNAAGKSNFLDVFRFLGDIASPGGGLAGAVDKRGGLTMIRSLFARNHRKGRLEIDVSLRDDDDEWKYRLVLRNEKGGKNRAIVETEQVVRNGQTLLDRPDADDEADPELLTQTHLEQVRANQGFRSLAEHFAKTNYFHPVPQVIRDARRAGTGRDDPFGGDFIAQMNATPPRTRNAWMKRIEKALRAAVPEFESLGIEVDNRGRPHLRAGYRNWRSTPAKHYETEFSDGTLRLIGLLWTVVSTPTTGGLILLEEPELSLNSAIVRTLPSMLGVVQRKRNAQTFLTTHAPELLDDEGVAPEEVLVLRTDSNGTSASLLSSIPEVEGEVAAELPTSGILRNLIEPGNLADLMRVGNPR